MGLLDGLQSDQGLLGLSLLAAAAPRAGGRTGFGEGLLGAVMAMQQRKTAEEDRAMKKQLMQAQLAETQAQAQQRAAQAQQAQQAAAQQAAFRRSLQGVSPQQAMAGGGGPTMANAAQIGQAPDLRALAMQYPEQAELIQKLAGAKNWGRDEVAARETVRGPDGMPVLRQLSKYGDRIGEDQAKPVEMRLENMGGHSEAVNPFALQAGQRFQRSQTPDSKASNALGWANYGLAKQRAAQEGAGQLVETPEGYVRVGRDNQAAPITMGGRPVMGKGTAPKDLNDAQSKALLFGTRAKEADATLGKLAAGGTIRPSLIKQGAESIPGIGGVLGAGANALFASPDQQSVEQAQRDFVNAILRRESGAVISDQEFANAQRQYFPQVGDAPQVIAQKARNRALATDLILREVPAAQRGGQAPGSPSLDDLLKKYGG